MAKPEKQKASGVSVLIDGINAKRIQTLGINSDIPVEQIEELANSGVVEYITDAPNVTIQIDTNDVGSVDTMSLLTDSLISYGGSVDSAGYNGARGGYYRHFIKTGSSNSIAITEQDMLNGYCSLMVTLNEDGTKAKRTMWLNHCAITSANLSYDVNGNASENYSLATDNKTWFFNDWANARCYKPNFRQLVSTAAQADYATSSGFQVRFLSSAIPDGCEIIAAAINGTILRTTANATGVTGNAEFTVVAASAFSCSTQALSRPLFSTADDSTDRVWIIFKDTSEGAWEATMDSTSIGWELESASDAVGAMRRGNIKAYLWNTGTDSEATSTAAGKALRLQTVAIDVALGEEQLYELGTDGFYAISKNTPVPITVTITANESDLEYYSLLTSTAFSNTAVKSVQTGDFNGNNAIKIQIYKDKAQTAANLLKTIDLNGMRVSAENFNVSVGDNATQEITFTTDNITITGAGSAIAGAIVGGSPAV